MNICSISSYFHVYMVLVLKLNLFPLLDFLLYLNIICTPTWFLLESFFLNTPKHKCLLLNSLYNKLSGLSEVHTAPAAVNSISILLHIINRSTIIHII